jgi:transcriptional regulator with XRE-family HTH domain
MTQPPTKSAKKPKPRPKATSVHRKEHRLVAQMLRELRLAAGLTQEHAGVAVGLTQAGISELENGARGLDLLVVRDLVILYGADWHAVIAELDRRIAADPKPAAALMRRPEADK